MPKQNLNKFISLKLQPQQKTIIKKVNALVNGSNIVLPKNPDLPENEPSVAVNPLNPLTIIAVAHDYTVDGFALYRSFDGGASFSYTILPVTEGFDLLSDPIIDFGLQNRCLISGLAANSTTNEASIIVFRSDDGGQSFLNSTVVSTEIGNGIFDDKEYLAIDKSPGSPFQGTAYISYTRFTNNGTQILLQKSENNGITWSVPVAITPIFPDLPFVQGSNITIGPNGEIYVGWIEGDFDNAIFRIRRSDDGGITFGPLTTVSNLVRVPDTLNSRVPAWGFRVPTFAFLAIDHSGCFNEGNFARVYAVWQDFRTGNAHILFAYSDDGGLTWSTPVRAENSPENTQNFFPFITVSPTSGVVTVIYYTNRVTNNLIDVFKSESIDQGLSFTDQRITDISFNPNADDSFIPPGESNSIFIGDYIFSAIIPPHMSEPEKLVSVWTGIPTDSQDIIADIQELPPRVLDVVCSNDIAVFNDPNQLGAIVIFDDPAVSNSCGDITISCSPPSGSFFPLGTTTVTCTATDENGNTGNCSFNVTVKRSGKIILDS
jgi:hypothetical protein